MQISILLMEYQLRFMIDNIKENDWLLCISHLHAWPWGYLILWLKPWSIYRYARIYDTIVLWASFPLETLDCKWISRSQYQIHFSQAYGNVVASEHGICAVGSEIFGYLNFEYDVVDCSKYLPIWYAVVFGELSQSHCIGFIGRRSLGSIYNSRYNEYEHY